MTFLPKRHYICQVRTIKTLREMVGIDQHTLCDASGVSRQAMSLYENGHLAASARVWKRVDEALQNLLDQRALEVIGAAIVERRVRDALAAAQAMADSGMDIMTVDGKK